jgi:hypothetical protein
LSFLVSPPSGLHHRQSEPEAADHDQCLSTIAATHGRNTSSRRFQNSKNISYGPTIICLRGTIRGIHS